MAEPGVTKPNCDDYCRLNQVACSGELAVYERESQCKSVCKQFTSGTLTDGLDPSVSGAQNNTLGCRYTHTYNALLAFKPGGDVSNDKVTSHCTHSGPGGAGVCGDDCTSYCQLLGKACPSQFAELAGGCTDTCTKALGGAKSVMYSDKLAKSGTSPLACRFLNLMRVIENPDLTATSCEKAVGRGGCESP
jgi:hypothetical protein